MPVVAELVPPPDVEQALRAFASAPRVLLFDSALQRDPVGRYAFLTADPFAWRQVERVEHGVDPFQSIEAEWRRFAAEPLPGLPPFQGGAAGLIGYETARAWERIPRAGLDEFELPDVALGLYDWVLAWDRAAGRAWIISHGFPETEPAARERRARARLAEVQARLAEPPMLAADRLRPALAAPPCGGHVVSTAGRVVSNFTPAEYRAAVARAIEYIRAGDVFQVNLAQRLLAPWTADPVELYLRLRRCNPAPFAAYFAVDDWALASASPERFVRLADGEVETRPIKGTRQRRANPEADLFTKDELRESAKDQAENVMIVDLLRNDLSRVCRPGSLRVPQLCGVETYETVQHLVSEIRGRLADGRSAWDLLRAVFPGGSITGAPKVRAMEIIAELEPTVRGPYCGSLAYVGFDGRLDSSILIRTFTVRRGWAQFPVGGGVIAQSDPQAEYEETLHKAAGLLRALETP